MQKQLFTKTRWLVTIMLLITFGVPKMWGAVTALTIPKSWTASNGKSAYTAALGCTLSGLGSDYSASGTKLKFDGTGDYMIIQLASSPAYVSYAILGNSFSGGTFKVQESSNGSTYTDVATYTTSPSGTKTNNLKAATRYIKFIYTNKSSGNIGLGTIVIKARTTITLNKNGGSADGSAVIAYNATAKESLSAPTYDASHEIEGYYAEAGCSTKVLNSDGSFAASSVSGWITSSKWSKDAATATLYAKWNSTGTSVSLTKAASSNGSFTLSNNGPLNTATAQTITVTGTPNTGYYLSGVTQSGASSTPTITKTSATTYTIQYPASCTGTSTITATFSPIWKLKGSFDSWGDGYAMSGSGTVSVTRSLAANTRYEFKFVEEGSTYYGNTGAIVHSVSDWTFATDKDNCVLYTGPAGDYTFSINTSTKAASISYPSVDHPNANYVYIKKGDGWSDARIYNWDSNSEARMSDWDGSPVLATCEICGTTYYYGAAYFNKLKFRDGGSNQSNEISLDRGKWLDETTHASSWSNFATYTISYAGGGGTGSMSSHTNLCPGSSQALTANAFSKAYHTFNGWSDGNGHTYANQATITNIQSNINLTAQWAANSYTVTTNLTNVTPNSAFPASVTYTGTITTALNRTLTVNTTNFSLPTSITVSMAGTGTLTPGTHYTYNNSTGAFAFNVAVTGNITITATALPKYTVTLKDDNSTYTQASYGASVTLPSRAGCTGYTFAGWTKSWTEEQDEWTTTAPTIIPAGSYTPSSNENLYPVYTKTEGGGTTDVTVVPGTYTNKGSGNYGSGAERTGTVSAINFGAHYITGNNANSPVNPCSAGTYLQCKASNANIYNKTAMPGNITKVVVNQYAAQNIDLYCGTSQLMASNNTSTGQTPSGSLQTAQSAATKMTWNVSGSYTYFDLKKGSGTSYITSIVITYANSTTSYISVPGCCENIIELSTGTLSHCTMSISPTNLQTCTGTDEDWQVTVTVTPDNGYGVPTNLTWTKTDGTVETPTKVSGPTGSGPYTYVYQFAQDQKGEGSFGATCTAKNYTINLNDQSATTAATPSSISVTFDASTNLTGTVVTTLPTRTGFDFGGYYTATGGGGVQIITDAGVVVANAGTGSYTDASRNWKHAGNLTIYAKWTEKALENYRTACMTFEVTNQTGTDDPDIHLTSYKGITVYATSAAGNLIRIQGKALEAAGALGAGTNKQNIRIKYFDMKSGSPVEVDKAQSPFRLCNDGTSNYNQADGSNININGLSSYDQTYSISYEPKEYGQTDHYQMEVRLQNNSTEAITVMVDLYGRSLPKEFVIATHSGASWYALPNDLAGTQGAQNLITPVAITVDNTSTPTKVTSVHDNVLYKGADRYTSANKNGLRFSNDGSHYLQVSTVLDVNKMWLSGSGGTDVQDWHLKSADFGAYEVYMDPIGTSTVSDGRRIELYDSYIGYHGALTGTGNVYFLPMEYPEMGSSIMEWGTDHVVIFLATPGTATKVKVQVGGNAVGDAQTLSDIKKDEGVYRVTASLTTDDAGAEIKLYFYTDGDVLVGSDKFTIPKLISAHDATTSGISKALAAECDLVILNGGILTVSQSTPGTQLAFRDLYIYGGGKLVVPSGKYISFDKVIMRGGHLNAAWQYQYSHPQLVLNGTMTNAEGKIYYDYLTNNAQFYSLSLPYNVTLTDIVNPDFNNKQSWQIHGYDGAKRASGSQVEGWYDVEEGSTPGSIAALSSSDHLTAGVGYTFWGAMQKVNGVRQRWSVNRFKMTLASGSAEAEKSGVTVTAHGMTAGGLKDGVAPNDAGWNMLGNPYLADIGGTEDFETTVKGTIISWHNVKDEDENGNWTGTWHQESNETNVRYVRIPNNQGTEYEQTRFKDATLRAFHHFFIQVGDGGTFNFNISMRAQNAPSRFRKGASLPEEMNLDLCLTDGDNTSQFGLTLNNEFSASYNGGDEDMTEDLSGAYVKAYTLVGETRLTFNGLPYTAAEQLIPVGYRAQGNGYHTFSYKADADAHYIAHIWLTDKEESTVTDLKENTYKFYTDAGVNDERFTLNVVFTENTATGMDDGINDENGKPMKFIYREQLYILRGGVIYDATGKRVREVNK